MSDDWERNIEVKGKCKTCGDTVSAAFVDEECMCCYYDYDHWDSSDEKAPWTILAKPGRGKGLKGLDITEEMAPLYAKMTLEPSDYVAIELHRETGRLVLHFFNIPLTGKNNMVTIKNFVAKNKVGPPCKLEGYIYCIKCWLDRRAINWTPIPEKRHLSTIGNEHGFCLPCAENAAFQTKANEEKRSAKVKVAQQEAREALPDEPINYIFPAFLGMLDAVDAYYNNTPEHLIVKKDMIQAARKGYNDADSNQRIAAATSAQAEASTSLGPVSKPVRGTKRRIQESDDEE